MGIIYVLLAYLAIGLMLVVYIATSGWQYINEVDESGVQGEYKWAVMAVIFWPFVLKWYLEELRDYRDPNTVHIVPITFISDGTISEIAYGRIIISGSIGDLLEFTELVDDDLAQFKKDWQEMLKAMEVNEITGIDREAEPNHGYLVNYE